MNINLPIIDKDVVSIVLLSGTRNEYILIQISNIDIRNLTQCILCYNWCSKNTLKMNLEKY